MQKQKISLNDFTMLSLIGVGNYAKVVLARKKSNNRTYAMKIVKKKKFENQAPEIKKSQVYIEKEILSECNHPFIIKMYSTFQWNRKLYFILEYCQGGQLFGIIKRNKRIAEESTKFYAAQILIALQYLHSKKFIFRDLKPENVLIAKNGYIRLVDFGLSCRISSEYSKDKVNAIAGTPEYLPPELFMEMPFRIGEFTDWWTFGSIIYEMVVGFPPFFSQNINFQAIKHKICFEEPNLYFINNLILRDLLKKLLNKNPHERLGTKHVDEIKNHAWFVGIMWEQLFREEISAPFIPEVKSDQDIQWFDMEAEENKFTPPEESISISNLAESYKKFSLSWKSSNSGESSDNMEQNLASPTEIIISIEESLNEDEKHSECSKKLADR